MTKSVERRIVEHFRGVASVSCADDGRIVAGENGGYGVVCWDASGAVAWKAELAPAPTSARYEHHVFVRVRGDAVIVAATMSDSFRVLDLATGAERARYDAPKDFRAMELTRDRARLVVRAFIHTYVFDAESFARVAFFDAAATSGVLALSPDDRYAAVCGGSLRVIDLNELAVARSRVVDDAPWSGVVVGDAVMLCRNVMRLYSLADLKLLKEMGSARSPITTAAAVTADGARVATASDRGTVTIFSASTFAVERELKGHDPTVPDTNSKRIAEIVFTREGDLVVSAPPKNEPMGVTIHRA